MFLVVVAAAIALLVFVSKRSRGERIQPEVGPVGWVNGMSWGAVRPLARIEIRRLLLHPAFVFGVLTFPLIAVASIRESTDEWLDISTGLALGLVPLGWFSIIAANLLASRSIRTGAEELFGSLPAPQPIRTAGVLATMAGPAIVAAFMAAATVAYVNASVSLLPGSPDYAEIGAGLLIAAGAVAVGVAVARFWPHPLFGVGAVVVVILIQARFLEPTTWPWNREEANPIRFFGFLGSTTSAGSVLEYRPAEWHLVYLVGLVALMAIVALARSGISRWVAISLTTAIAVAAVGGWMQSRPPSADQVAEMIRYLEHPEQVQTCESTEAARICVYASGERNIAAWSARLRSVMALMPANATRRVEVRERIPTVVANSNCSPIPATESLVKKVAQSIDPQRVWRKDNVVHPGTDTLPCSGKSLRGFFFAVQVASQAVGLRPSPWGLDERCYADGQARAALALWLGAAATPQGTDVLRQLVDEATSDHLGFVDWDDPPMWGVRFSISDARHALALLQRPRRAVADAVGANWARLSAPATPTAELASVVGVTLLAAPAPPTSGPLCQ